MLIKISDNTLQLLKEDVIPSLKINTMINQAEIECIFNYLESKEIYLSQDIEDGLEVDREYLDRICKAIDELNVEDIKQIDIEDLNRRLSAL